MLSFQGQYTQCQNLAQDESADALTFFKTNLNLGLHLVEVELGSYILEEPYTETTTASNDTYDTPDRFVRLKKAYVTVSNVRHLLEEVRDENEWQAMKSAGNVVSDIATHIFVRRESFEIYPTPTTTAGKVITLICEISGKELSFADHTAGTITTLASGASAVTGSSTSFTAAMAGRYLRIDSYPVWYRISSYTSATSITLDKKYTGISISAGTEAYTIGEMPHTPESTHQIPVWYALMNYYQGFKQNKEKGLYYKNMFELDLKRAKTTFKKRYSSNYIPGRRSKIGLVNVNDYPTDISY